MKKTVDKIINEQTGLEYKLHKDELYYPVIKVDKRKNYFIGKYGRMHEGYIRENDEVLYNHLLLNGELHHYLHQVDKRANEIHKIIKEGMIEKAEKAGEFDNIKDRNEWHGLMMNFHFCAEEVVLNEVVYGGSWI